MFFSTTVEQREYFSLKKPQLFWGEAKRVRVAAYLRCCAEVLSYYCSERGVRAYMEEKVKRVPY